MCTWLTVSTDIRGSGKGASGEWIEFTDAHIYFDHPQRFTSNHALIVDLVNSDQGPGARVAIELNAESARKLINSIETVLEAVDERILIE